MSENPYQNMAKQFMDLWQKQVASVMSDKQFIHAMLDLLKTAQNPDAYAKAAASSQPARADDAGHGDMANLAFRLAQCERRLGALENTAKKPPRAAKSAVRRSKKPRN